MRAQLRCPNWAIALRDPVFAATVGEAEVVAWLIVELAGRPPHNAVHRASLKAARRSARAVPGVVADTLRAAFGVLAT